VSRQPGIDFQLLTTWMKRAATGVHTVMSAQPRLLTWMDGPRTGWWCSHRSPYRVRDIRHIRSRDRRTARAAPMGMAAMGPTPMSISPFLVSSTQITPSPVVSEKGTDMQHSRWYAISLQCEVRHATATNAWSH